MPTIMELHMSYRLAARLHQIVDVPSVETLLASDGEWFWERWFEIYLQVESYAR